MVDLKKRSDEPQQEPEIRIAYPEYTPEQLYALKHGKSEYAAIRKLTPPPGVGFKQKEHEYPEGRINIAVKTKSPLAVKAKSIASDAENTLNVMQQSKILRSIKEKKRNAFVGIFMDIIPMFMLMIGIYFMLDSMATPIILFLIHSVRRYLLMAKLDKMYLRTNECRYSVKTCKIAGVSRKGLNKFKFNSFFHGDGYYGEDERDFYYIAYLDDNTEAKCLGYLDFMAIRTGDKVKVITFYGSSDRFIIRTL